MNLRIPIESERVAAFCRRWKITELSLFGSVLGDDFGPGSDVDVLVTFAVDAEWSLWDLVDMREELQEVLGRQVHLVERGALRNPFRRAAVLRRHLVIYAA